MPARGSLRVQACSKGARKEMPIWFGRSRSRRGGGVLLIYTTSYDTTVDLLLHHLGPEACFRYNFDLWRDYRLEIRPGDFRIEDPTGRSIDRARTHKVLYRKPQVTRDLDPQAEISAEDAYSEEELWYALRDLMNLLWADGKLVLVEPRADMRVGKFVQAEAAQRHFPVPEYRFVCGRSGASLGACKAVVKSLTFESVAGRAEQRVIYTTPVRAEELSTAHPWMMQEYVQALSDVTVVFVRDRLFAFELDRTPFLDRAVDWRELPTDATATMWRPHALPRTVEEAIFAFMRDLRLHFGRLDFLFDGTRYVFLEVNPNGQWGWLDAEGRHGLLAKIIEEVSPSMPCHPIPSAPGTCRPAVTNCA